MGIYIRVFSILNPVDPLASVSNLETLPLEPFRGILYKQKYPHVHMFTLKTNSMNVDISVAIWVTAANSQFVYEENTCTYCPYNLHSVHVGDA